MTNRPNPSSGEPRPMALPDGRRLVPLISRQDIAWAVGRIASEIDQDLEGTEPVLMGVLKGAYPFLADLSRALTLDHVVDFLRVRSYGGSTQSGGRVELLVPPSENLEGKTVVVVEDILDSGRTFDFIVAELERRGAEEVRVAMLLKRAASAVLPDYLGIEIAGGFVVGYGMDLGERFRGLPDIYVLEEAG